MKELTSGTWHLTYKYSKHQYDRGAVIRYLSTDAGLTWGSPRVISPREPDYAWMEPQTRDGARYLVAAELFGLWFLFRSMDSGITYHQTAFTPLYSPPSGERYSWNGRDYGWLSDSLCYAVGTDGYCISRDGGSTWSPEDGHVVDGVRRLIIGDSSEQWFVGLNGLILQHRGPLGVMTSTDPPSPAPRDFSLPVTYPNPASSSSPAQVAFTLERDMPVSVVVYDLLGRRQRILHEGRLTAGPQRFTFGTAGLPPGLYFVTVSTPEGVRVGKVVVGR